MREDAKLERLARIPLFSRLARRDLERVAQLCTEVTTRADQVLCREGTTGEEFFVVLDGRYRVEAGGREVASLGSGDFFGELALLDGGPRTATVVSDGAGSVLVVARQEFDALLHDEPVVAVRMLPGIGARFRAMATSPAGAEVPPGT